MRGQVKVGLKQPGCEAMVTAFVFYKIGGDKGGICQDFVHCPTKRTQHQVDGRMRFYSRLHLRVDVRPKAICHRFVSVTRVNLEINGHTGDYPRYTTRTDQNGDFKFANIQPSDYGFGIYLNMKISERQCEAPEYSYSRDLKWLHYATWSKVDVWYDILFSSVDVTVDPGETVALDFVLKCP